jgi:phosphotriesterase-related protein
MAARIMTVRGPITPDQLGFASLHEHILCDLADCYRDRYRWGNVPMPDWPLVLENRSSLRHAMILSSSNLRLDDEEVMAAEVADFAAAQRFDRDAKSGSARKFKRMSAEMARLAWE